jgi:hypothetical protein
MSNLPKLVGTTLTFMILFMLSMQTTAKAQSPPPFILVAAGDIADCNSEGDTDTASQIQTIIDARRYSSVGISVVALGDNAYEAGTIEEFRNCYDPTWGKYLTWTLPVVGNHEYLTPNAAGYVEYFGPRGGDPDKLYYSATLPNNWLFIALNSNCGQVGGCSEGTPQETWLRDVLAANPDKCIIAAAHQMPFSSGQNGDQPRYAAFAKALYESGADLVIGGHDHNYQRFVPMNHLGQPDPDGFREFVIGTGGSNYGANITPTVPITSAALKFRVFGVTEFRLYPDFYTWEFSSTDGSYVDSGAGFCQGGLDWFLPPLIG